MKLTTLVLVSALSAALPVVAAAQQTTPDDVAYCTTLAQTWQRWRPTWNAPTAADGLLLSGCANDTRATTETLKRRLSDNKLDLPPNPAVANAPAGTPNALR
jgi:hypothetical protein